MLSIRSGPKFVQWEWVKSIKYSVLFGSLFLTVTMVFIAILQSQYFFFDTALFSEKTTHCYGSGGLLVCGGRHRLLDRGKILTFLQFLAFC